MLIKVLGGFLMALADSVPGVSGGTIAFLMGIYDDFINSLNNVVSKDKEKRMASWKFLAKMGSGWIVGMALAAIIIGAVFEEHIYAISSLFIGFILFAIPIIIMEEKESFKGKYYNIVFLVLGAAVVAAVTYFSTGASGIGSLEYSNLTFGKGALLFVGAMCAISAMVLPGISGSTILVVFGLYQPVMFAISAFLHMEFEYIPGLMIFGFGVLAGIFTVVKGLKVLLEKFRSAIMYFVIGMMLGSFYAIIMGPTTLKDNPQDALSFDTFNIWFFIIGGVVIFGIQALKGLSNKLDKKAEEK
jgi:putative membrane protein